MAIRIDKEKKRKKIAIDAKKLILENGINNITVSQIAKFVNIGKGTIYEYFLYKNEIVFKLIEILMKEHNEIKKEELSKLNTTKDKIKSFFSFFYNDSDNELREIYKQFISISISNPNEDISNFQTKILTSYKEWINKIIKDGIENKELKNESIGIVNGLFFYVEGVFISSITTNYIIDIKKEINNQINLLFKLLEVK